MRWTLQRLPAALVVALAVLGTARSGQAQWMGPGGGFDPGFSTYGAGGFLAEEVNLPYSYFAAFPGPARIYVPYNQLDTFHFHGQPYGRPYDRWSWTYLTGTYGAPARYFYPPLQ